MLQRKRLFLRRSSDGCPPPSWLDPHSAAALAEASPGEARFVDEPPEEVPPPLTASPSLGLKQVRGGT